MRLVQSMELESVVITFVLVTVPMACLALYNRIMMG